MGITFEDELENQVIVHSSFPPSLSPSLPPCTAFLRGGAHDLARGFQQLLPGLDEGKRDGRREGGREGGRERRREGGREGGREGLYKLPSARCFYSFASISNTHTHIRVYIHWYYRRRRIAGGESSTSR